MSKKGKRIKKLEQLNADMAIECDEMEMTISRLRGSNIKMIDGLLRIRKERDELQRQYDERGEYVAYLEGQADDLMSIVRHVDELEKDLKYSNVERGKLRHDLGECKAGREALQRKNTVLARQREQWQSTAVKRTREIKELQSAIETAHRWKTYADSIESQIEILQAAIDERDERLDNIKFFLSDGDE